MDNDQFKYDFLSFTLGGISSRDMNIWRVSSSNRNDLDLTPAIQDKTVQVPGGDGTYFFGSFYTQRSFSIPIAFDSMTESDVQTLRLLLSSKTPQKLVFSEQPDRYYWVKSTSNQQIKFVPFLEDTTRVFKGEGTLQFTAYYPFGISEDITKYWSKPTEEPVSEVGEVDIVNLGDIPMPVTVTFTTDSDDVKIELFKKSDNQNSVSFVTMSLSSGESYIFDTYTHILKNSITNTVLNNRILTGDFFEIPADATEYILKVTGISNVSVNYKYLYL